MNIPIAEINTMAESLVPLLWKATWQGGLALLLVLVICRAVKKIPARGQCWLWRLAFLKLLIVGLSLTPTELPLLPPVAVAHSHNSRSAKAESHLVTISPVSDKTHYSHGETTFSPPSDEGQESSDRGAHITLNGWGWLLFAWVGGVIISIVRLLRDWIHVRKLISNASEIVDHEILDDLSRYCRRMNVNRQPKLYQSAYASSPCLIGIVCPKIVIPPGILEMESTEFVDTVLIHELAHIKRHDLLWNWLPALVDVLFYFHPMVWWSKREWRVAQEISTDELAIRTTNIDVARYAKTLVELVTTCQPSIPSNLAVGVSETYSQYDRRISAMKSMSTLNRKSSFILLILIFVVALFGIAPWKLTAKESSAQSIKANSSSTSTSKQLAQSKSRMKKISLALLNYESAHGHMPAAAIYDKEGKPLLSWRVHILPFLEQQSLYDQFHLDERWDSKHNQTLIKRMPDIFASNGFKTESGKTRFLVVTGSDTVFPANRGITMRQIHDGTSNTVAFVEGSQDAAVAWTKPDDLTLSDGQILNKIIGKQGDGFLAAFVDGRVKNISSTIDLNTLKALLFPADGRTINFEINTDSELIMVRVGVGPVINRPPTSEAGGHEGGYGEYELGIEMRSESAYEMRGGSNIYRQAQQGEMEIVLTSRGTVLILGRQVPVNKLGPILAAIKEADDKSSISSVAIKLPKSTDFQHLCKLTQQCENHGFQKIRLVSESTANR